MMARLFTIFALTIALALPATAEQKPRILVMGDSLLAWHSTTGRSIGQRLSKHLKQPVKSHAVSSARMIYRLPVTGAMGLSIPRQYRDRNWQWVIVNGGGNDLWLGCGCNRCKRKMNKMISPDGTKGEIPALVARIRKSGARVIWLGYLRSPGFNTPIEHCKNEGDALEARIRVMARGDDGVIFHSIADLVPKGDLSFHALDRIHPSVKASDAIARRLAQVIRDAAQ